MFDMISVFLNLLRFDLWPKMWSTLENVPCALEKKVYSSAYGWKVLKIQGLCINLEGWDGEVDEKEVQKGGDICISMADLCWGLTEKNKIL